MGTIDNFDRIVSIIQNDPLIKKHICKYHWVSGGSTDVAPITCWKESRQIIVQLKSRHNVFEKCISRIICKSSGIVSNGFFWKSDGTCPCTLTFVLKGQ